MSADFAAQRAGTRFPVTLSFWSWYGLLSRCLPTQATGRTHPSGFALLQVECLKDEAHLSDIAAQRGDHRWSHELTDENVRHRNIGAWNDAAGNDFSNVQQFCLIDLVQLVLAAPSSALLHLRPLL